MKKKIVLAALFMSFVMAVPSVAYAADADSSAGSLESSKEDEAAEDIAELEDDADAGDIKDAEDDAKTDDSAGRKGKPACGKGFHKPKEGLEEALKEKIEAVEDASKKADLLEKFEAMQKAEKAARDARKVFMDAAKDAGIEFGPHGDGKPDKDKEPQNEEEE